MVLPPLCFSMSSTRSRTPSVASFSTICSIRTRRRSARKSSNRFSAGLLGVDEVAEQVDLAPVEERGELDAGHEPQADPVGRLLGGRQTGDRVVVAQRPDLHARRGGALGDLRRGVLSVGGAAVGVEVDEAVGRAGQPWNVHLSVLQ